MTLPLYLAMTAAEISYSGDLPAHLAYMACHFSSYGAGLSNLPESLPVNSLVILNDRIPVAGHDPALIAEQLRVLCGQVQAAGLVMDLQRQEEMTLPIIERILETAVCPVAVSDIYADKFDCPVFLSAPPLYASLAEHMAPWQGRDIWLEAATDGCGCTVTEDGSVLVPCVPEELPLPCPELFCHYRIEEGGTHMNIRLSRRKEDLMLLLEQSQAKLALGLYQQLGQV